jgi:hypothetical protein
MPRLPRPKTLYTTLCREIDERYPSLTPEERRYVHETAACMIQDFDSAMFGLVTFLFDVPEILASEGHHSPRRALRDLQRRPAAKDRSRSRASA